MNGQLWTVPFELCCSCCLTLITLLGPRRRRALAPTASVVVVLAYLAVTLARHNTIVPVSEAVNGAILFASFLAGVYLGLLNPSRKYLLGADYAYGLFLYGFGIKQTLMHPLPAARSGTGPSC